MAEATTLPGYNRVAARNLDKPLIEPLICKKITFCVNFHLFVLTIGLFLPFSAAKKWLE